MVFSEVFYTRTLCLLTGGCYILLGPEHQELQVPEVANVAELQQPASSAPHRNSPAEQPDGAVVADAFPHAVCVRLPQ